LVISHDLFPVTVLKTNNHDEAIALQRPSTVVKHHTK